MSQSPLSVLETFGKPAPGQPKRSGLDFDDLTDGQKNAVNAFGSWFLKKHKPKRHFIIVGYAGTGKTTIIPFLMGRAGLRPEDVAGFCVAAKAAEIMKRKTRKLGFPCDTATLHSLLYSSKRIKRPKLNADKTIAHDKNGEMLYEIIFTRKKRTDEEIVRHLSAKKLILIDEGSMVSQAMFQIALRAQLPILVMGDSGQLPPIVGKDEPVTKVIDIMQPDVEMTEIKRQGDGSMLIRISDAVRKGWRVKAGIYGDNFEMTALTLKDFLSDKQRRIKQVLAADQIIVATQTERVAYNKLVRAHTARSAKSPNRPVIGDTIMCLQNNQYIHVGNSTLTNGSFYKIIDILHVDEAKKLAHIIVETVTGSDVETRGDITITLEGFNEIEKVTKSKSLPQINNLSPNATKRTHKIDPGVFDYAYAITGHKSQGSEWDKVLIIYQQMPYAAKDWYEKWVYTAITRAKTHVLFVNADA